MVIQIFSILLMVFFLFGCISENQPRITLPLKDTFYRRLSSQPPSLHPIRSSDYSASLIHSHVLDHLIGRNHDTNQLEPRLAHKWKIDSNQLVYTFYIRKNAQWHDGKPVTAEDVKFSFDAVMDVKKYEGYHQKPYFENIEKSEIVDSYTIRFYAKKKVFGSFENLATLLNIIPKHIYQPANQKLNKTIVGSGPYVFSQYQKGKKIILTKNQNWWGNSVYSDKYSFKKIVFKIIPNTQDALLRTEQSRIDFLGLSAESYFKKTSSKNWQKTITKHKIVNLQPKGYSFIAWNLNNDLFQNRDVRKALAQLLNRSEMNQKFNHHSSYLIAGPCYPQNDYVDSSVSPVLFNPIEALERLNQAGWMDSDQNGILDRTYNGEKKEFRFTILYPAKDMEKYLILYQQDLQKYGIQMDLKYVEWISFTKLMNERSFDAVTLAWTGGEVEWYPKQIWHSSSSAGSNFIDYKNKEVDRLIDLSDQELNRLKRIQILKKAYRLIANDHPYAFLFSPKYRYYAVSKRIQIPKPTFQYSLGWEFWRIQPNL